MPRAGSRSRTPPPPATAPAGTPRHGPGSTDGRNAHRWAPRPARPTSTRRSRRPAARSRTPPASPPPRSAPQPARTGTGPVPGRACRGPATARRCSAASTAAPARVNPAARVQLLPGQQVTGAPLVIQPVGQLGHHLPVPAVPAPEQPQGQHEIHHQPRRQQPAPLLPRPGRVHRGVHQLRSENPGQDTNRDPVRQPAVRRQPLRTIMRHKTVTIPRQTLKQGHWAVGPNDRRVVASALSDLRAACWLACPAGSFV